MTNQSNVIKYVDIMPRAITKEPVKDSPKTDDSYTVTIPRVQALKKISFVQVLTVLLLIETFFLGSLYTKVQTLEKNSGTTTTTTTGTTQNTDTQTPPSGLTPGEKVDVDPGDLPVKGDPNAKVTIVEFSDFQCPFCQKLYTDTLPSVIKDYVDTGKAKLTFRHYPLPFHTNAQKAGEASECANDQGKFWEMHDKLFASQQEWESLSAADAQAKFSEYAGGLDMDTATFDSCLSSEKYKTAVTDDMNAGSQAGVSATPTVFVNGIPIVGAESYAVFKQTIDQELAK